MMRFLDEPAAVERMGRSARERSRLCDATAVAARLRGIVGGYLR